MFAKTTSFTFRLVSLCMFFFLLVGSVETPPAHAAGVIPVDGNWSGYTHLGQPVSFVVQSGGTQWANFSLTVRITFPNDCTVTMTQTMNGPGTITNGQFSFTGMYFAFTGQFASDLTASGTYAFINQLSACGTFTHSGTWSAMTPLPVPGAFSKTNPPDGATNQSVNAGGVGWTSSNYTYHYEWCIDQVDNDQCDTSWAVTSYTSAGWPVLEPETTYYWQVQAVNPSGITQANGGDWFTFTTGTPPTGFNKISPLNGAITSTSVTYTWEPSSTATSYQICIDATNDESCDAGNWVSVGANTSVTYSGASNHATFYWQVLAYNSGGYTEADNGAWHSLMTFDPPGSFSKDWPYDLSTNLPTSLTLSWNVSAETEYYEYCYDTNDNDQCDESWKNVGNTLSAATSGLSYSTNYYWQVRAVNQGGTTYPTYDSGWWRFTTAPPPPASFHKTGPADGEQNQPPWPTLSWSASAGADYYRYCFDTTDNDQCDSTWSGEEYQTSVQLNNLTADTTYYWQVQAVNGGGMTGADDQAWWSIKTDIPQVGPAYSVNSTSGGKDGLCGSGHCTLRDAVSVAEADGVASLIQLQAGITYILTEVDNSIPYSPANGLPIINTAITIQGNGATIQRSSLYGTPEFRFFQVGANGGLTIHNLTFQGGYLGGFYDGGGAIFNMGQLTIHNSAFIANSANNGGAIANEGTAVMDAVIFNQNHSVPGSMTCGSAAITNSATLTIENSEFTANGRSNPDSCSGAIYQNGLSLTVINSIFREHVASHGAVIGIDADQNITITNSTFDSNSMTPIGANDSAIQVSGSTFSDNAAYASGGIYVQNSNLSVSNSTFWNNSAIVGVDYFNGGGINADGGVIEVTNSTFANNSAAEGAAIFGTYSNFTVRNSIFANSTHGENCGGYGSATTPIMDDGHNLDTGSSCIFSAADHSLSNTNPLLGVLQNNGGPTKTLTLLPGSPAIDTGDNAVCQADPVNNLDQRGAARPMDGDKNGSAICDMGAYESPAWSTPGAFTKVSPPNAAQAQPAATVLSWGPSTDAESYAYCVDTNDNGQCDTSWVDTGANMFAGLNNLTYATTYYWQVRANNAGGTTYANDSLTTFWPFTTVPSAPGAFNKSAPLNSAVAVSTSPTLSWAASTGATSYEYCYDTTNDNACSTWTDNGLSTTKTLSGLTPGAKYYWHVRANNAGGTTYANTNTWWSFTTLSDTATFDDVSTTYWARQFIERLYSAGITGGCSASPLMYCPDSSVTRAQMAIFLLKGIHGSSYSPPAVNGDTTFTDVATNHWAAPWIKQLAAEGITSGCGNGNYCPESNVTRAQMAIFLLKAKHGSAYSPPAVTGVFTDVPAGYWARNWIEQLAAEGITSGCGAGVYCPEADVSRAQMAVFLVKTFNLP